MFGILDKLVSASLTTMLHPIKTFFEIKYSPICENKIALVPKGCCVSVFTGLAFLGTGHEVRGGGGEWAGRNRGWVINFQADEKGWVT